MTARPQLLLAFAAWLAFASVAAARENTLEQIKDLYRSAAYEQALALLDAEAGDEAVATSTEAKEYRLLCLIALGRTGEARVAIESMLNANPFYELPQVAPRVRAIFGEARRSLLPAIAQRAYIDAKAAFDRRDPESAAQFDRVLILLEDPDVAAAPAMADLRTVASGFRDLSKAVAVPPAPIVTEPAASGAPAAASQPIVYREGEPDLVLPETLNQTVPRWIVPSRFAGASPRNAQGWLEIIIDESGNVASTKLVRPLHPAYDAQLIKAAMSWKYRPARKSGTPVRFLKVIHVRLDAAGQTN